VWRTLQASAQGEGRCVACLQLVGHLRPQAPQLHGGQGSVVHTHVVHTAAEGVQVAGRRRADEQRGALRGYSPCSRIHNSRRIIEDTLSFVNVRFVAYNGNPFNTPQQ
jgi:hypothetical protein